ICSTWGREHFKTFDGDVYQFPGTCEYNLVSDCHEAYQEFSVHMKRSNIDGIPTVAYVVVTIDDIMFHLTKSQITVNDEPVSLPYFKAGVHLEQNAVYIKFQSKVGITVMWNREDAVMVEIDNDYANRTCGLCGDFNGVPVYDEFIHEGHQINPIEYGNRQKVHRPNDECEDPYEGDDESPLPENTQDKCKKFVSCLVSSSFFILACVQDMCGCNDTPSDFCLCSTLSEFSRQCSHAGGDPPRWRKADFCAKQCPYNMVYEESGSPCMDTCSRRDTSSMCEDHKMDGCFCHSGKCLMCLRQRGMVSLKQIVRIVNPYVHVFGYGIFIVDFYSSTCREGSWACQSLQAPETCAVEEGSHVTTFDGKTFTFHGDCYYTLAKDGRSPKFTVLAQLMPCTNQEFDTCLKTVKLLLNNNKNNVNITIFQASSFHILLQTNFGLQIQVQVVPLMQVYIKLDQSYTGKTRGLCGNYNMVLSDEMKTPQGIVEGTATTFTNSWKANVMCSDKEERLEDPCSFSMENEHYAKHWCALLKSQNSTFTSCHSLVDPDIYYKRCMYSSCNCEKSEACLCGVFSSYARACASMGVVLPDWKENVCGKSYFSCPGSQVFSFNHQRCQLTCRSLALKEQNCISNFSPVDGCSCAEGSYLDDKGICVPVSKCPCFYNDIYIKPGKSVSIKDEHCVCTNGILHCRSLRLRGATCPSPKVFFNCSSTSSGELGLQCARTCSNLDGDDCDFTECESGCRCPNGLLDDGKGSCVTEEECPCQHEGQIYQPGTKIPNQCNNCICKSGRWLCTRNKCPGYCVFYGSGHYSTFDQKTYGFPGDCAYVAVKNNCGNKAVLNSFGIMTENVPCGTTRATCSKAIRIQMGDKEIKFSKNKFEETDLGYGPEITYKIRRVGMYLVLESNIGVGVIWDRKTTVRIVLEPQHSGEVCGLCGNFDGDAQNDFMTQNNIVVNNALEFGNSWKLSSTCPDVTEYENPCDASPNRQHWAKQMCSIITGPAFIECKKRVDPLPFYENCVKDSCACDSGGDCDCFCTAVAAYAQACNEARVCVAWRTPEICPIFCDYYNKPGECQWHYKECHPPCFETCLYPDGCLVDVSLYVLFTGCYPKCPPETPIFDESTQTCVNVCPTPPPPTTPTTTTTTSTTTTPPTTTPCSPECEWSDWYDVHDPITDHSDWETYENITNSGAHICENRKEIECRSTLFPDKDLDDFLAETHQVVTCDLNYGFICRKEDQKRPPRKCYDYMIRVCCDNCNPAPTTPPPTTTTTTPPTTTTTPPTTTTTTPPTTTTTTPPTTTTTTPPTTTTTTPPTTTTTTPPTTTTTTPPTTTTTTPPTTTTTTPPTTTTTTPPTTTTTTPPTTTTTTPPTTTTTTPPTTTTTTPPTTTTTTPPTTTTTTPPTTTPPTTTPPTTTTTTPPTTTTTTPPTTTTTTPPTTTTTTTPNHHNYNHNETFWLCECYWAICLENDTIDIIHKVCPPLKNITCERGLKPVLVKDKDDCCSYYACPCVCEGWGDPHYNTFDNLYYSYQGNCTYILMQEIIPEIDLTIYVDNVNCDPLEDVSCPRSLIISYQTEVIFFLKIISPVIVTFGLAGFKIDLPYQHFGNNTQGHCGTCNNDQKDDCMLPGGQTIKDCAIMADYWLANDISQENCPQPTVPPTGNPEPQPSLAPCKPNSLCDLLHSSPFTACHHVISPENFYKGCVYDSCHMSNPAVECTSLQTYAASCAQAGVCIYWRNHTKLCSSNCPANMVYKPCGPAEQPTCEDNKYEPTMNYTSEGCFCPEGTKLFNKQSGICVEKCGKCCGLITFYKCQDCICEETTKTVVCKPKVCPKPPVAECKEPGFELVSQTDPSNPCCETFVCQCKLSNCPITDLDCPVGFKPTVHFPPGKCCPEQRCGESIISFLSLVYTSGKLSMKTHVTHNNCQSAEMVDMSYCEGPCNTYSIYSQSAEGTTHSCACCKEVHSSNRTVNLLCLNGETIPYSYMHVEECGCSQTSCTKPGVHDRRRRSFTLT
uniref:Mucin-2-like n=1 Tax=Gouania willdenowi TaxID=441366 RepID=A0A8C5H0H0_GOUWI